MGMLLTLHVDLTKFYRGFDSDCSRSTKNLDTGITILNRQVPENRELAVDMVFQYVAITQVKSLDELGTELLVALMLVFPS